MSIYFSGYFIAFYFSLDMSGLRVYNHDMTDIIKQDLMAKIAELIYRGESPNEISLKLGINQNQVIGVLGDSVFAANLLNLFKIQAKGAALIAHNNIIRIAFDSTASAATQLKASKILVDIARELQELHPNDLEPANMSQAQLADRLKSLQKEALARAKPIDTGVIDVKPSASLDDMLE